MPMTIDEVLRADVIDKAVPATLRSVAPFLEEAQSILRTEPDVHRAHVAMYCIDHGFELVDRFNLQLDEVGKATIKQFAEVRANLLVLFPYHDGADHTMHMPDGTKRPGVRINPEEVLVAEATATMDLGEDELKEGMKASAARNFHTATVYFRVLESLVPNLTQSIHEKLQYCAMRTRQCSHLLENFVQEHFEANEKFTDVYDIHEKSKLGKGSYGSVFLCRHKKTGDEFACKLISLNRINSHYLRKLHLEIGIMKEITHPQIIQLHEVFFGSRTVYLVMELCSGGELFDFLQKHGQKGLSQNKVAHCARDMLSSIRYLHENNVMHRDLKLENYLFDSDKEDASLKLIDFGLSKHFEAHENLHQVVGSAYYTAPEVLQGNYDQSCDLWSIGVIIYMLLSGSPPFYGDSSELIHEMIKTKEADFGHKRFGHVAETATDFVRKLLTKDVSMRMNVEQAMEHPFITALNEVPNENSTTSDPVIMTQVTSSLTQFLRQNESKQIILKIVAFSLTPQQINTLRDEFHTIDANRNGSLSMSELKDSIANFKGIDKQTVEKHSQQMGINDEEELNYNEFVAAAMCKRISIDEERLHLAFETMDTAHTGYITKQNVIDLLGQDCTDELIEEMFHDLDLRGDNRVDYREFLVFWRGIMIKTHVTPLQRFRGAAKRVSHLLKMHTSGSSSEKKGGISSIFSATANATGGDSTIISEGSGSPDSPIKHGVKELSIEDDTESKVKEVGKTQSETKANDPFGLGWW